MLRSIPALLALALAALSPHADAIPVQLELGPTPACRAPLGPACFVGHDTQGTPNVGDDDIYAYTVVKRVAVTAPLLPGAPRVAVDAEATYVEHPFFAQAEEAWSAANATLPSEAHQIADLGQGTTSNGLQGMWVDLHPYTVVPVQDPDRSHTILVLMYVPHLVERDRVYPLWDGSNAAGMHTDRLLDMAAEVSGWCLPEEASLAIVTCHARSAIGSHAARILEESLPNVHTNGGLDRVEFTLGGSPLEADFPIAALGSDPTSPLAAAAPMTDPAPLQGVIADASTPWTAASWPGATSDQHKPGPSTRSLQASPPERAWLAPWLLAAAALLAPAWMLFHRVTRARSLDHAHRARLLELANAKPGILVGEAARILDVTYHCARHHARVLHRCGHLELVQAGRYTALYPAFAVALRHRVPLVHLRRGPQAETLRLLHEHPGAGVMQLAQRTGCSKSAMSAKLQRLRAQGLVEKDGRSYFITALGLEAMMLLPGSPGSALPGLEPAPPHAGGGSATSALGPGSMP